MDKQWVEMNNQRILDEVKSMEDKIRETIMSSPIISDARREIFLNDVSEYSTFITNLIVCMDSDNMLRDGKDKKLKDGLTLIYESIKDVFENFTVDTIKDEIKKYRMLDIHWYMDKKRLIGFYDRYLDSEPMEFDGDIVITDPSYLMKEETYEEKQEREKNFPNWDNCLLSSRTKKEAEEKYQNLLDKYYEKYKDDWEICNYGKNISIFGITKFMMRDTIEGDWTREIERETECHDEPCLETIGEFCSDSGLVCVADLEQVMKYNPNFRTWAKSHPWCASIIEGFKGTVQFVVKPCEEYGDFEDGEFYVNIIGKGTYHNGKETCNFHLCY